MSDDGDRPIYEEAVDEYLMIVKGPFRLVGGGRISPPLTDDLSDLANAADILGGRVVDAPTGFLQEDDGETPLLAGEPGQYLILPLDRD